MSPLKRFQCSSDCRWPYIVLSRKIVYRFLFPRLSPPGDRWRGVLGFVPAGSLKLFNTSDLPRSKLPARVALPARSFSFTSACPGQYIYTTVLSLSAGCFARSVIFLHFCMSRAVHIHRSIILICRFQVLEFKSIRRRHASWPVKRSKCSIIAISSFILYQYLSKRKYTIGWFFSNE